MENQGAVQAINPFDAETEAIKAQQEAENLAQQKRGTLLSTVVKAVKTDRFYEKKSRKFDSNVLQSTYSHITMEQIPDGSLSGVEQTRQKLSAAMGFKHTTDTENIAICAVKLPIGTTIQQLEEALRNLVGEENFISKDYFRTSNVDMKAKFRETVDTVRYLNTYNECSENIKSAPYAEFQEQARSIVKEEEEKL